MKYVILNDSSVIEFEKKVNEALQNGAQLIGGVIVKYATFYQAVLYP